MFKLRIVRLFINENIKIAQKKNDVKTDEFYKDLDKNLSFTR